MVCMRAYTAATCFPGAAPKSTTASVTTGLTLPSLQHTRCFGVATQGAVRAATSVSHPLLTRTPLLFNPPAEDAMLPMGYTADSVVEGKAAAKAELRKRMGLSNAGEGGLWRTNTISSRPGAGWLCGGRCWAGQP